MIRAFVAIRPPPAACERLDALGAALPEGRPTDSENLHLTLAFLGDCSRAQLEDLALELDARPMPGFDLDIDGVGVFGAARPRSAHARIETSPRLSALHRAVRGAAHVAGIALPARKFAPHVTLARFSGAAPAGEGLARWIADNAGLRWGPFAARSYALLRSDLTARGPIYSEMLRFDLTAPAADSDFRGVGGRRDARGAGGT